MLHLEWRILEHDHRVSFPRGLVVPFHASVFFLRLDAFGVTTAIASAVDGSLAVIAKYVLLILALSVVFLAVARRWHLGVAVVTIVLGESHLPGYFLSSSFKNSTNYYCKLGCSTLMLPSELEVKNDVCVDIAIVHCATCKKKYFLHVALCTMASVWPLYHPNSTRPPPQDLGITVFAYPRYYQLLRKD